MNTRRQGLRLRSRVDRAHANAAVSGTHSPQPIENMVRPPVLLALMMPFVFVALFHHMHFATTSVSTTAGRVIAPKIGIGRMASVLRSGAADEISEVARAEEDAFRTQEAKAAVADDPEADEADDAEGQREAQGLAEALRAHEDAEGEARAQQEAGDAESESNEDGGAELDEKDNEKDDEKANAELEDKLEALRDEAELKAAERANAAAAKEAVVESTWKAAEAATQSESQAATKPADTPPPQAGPDPSRDYPPPTLSAKKLIDGSQNYLPVRACLPLGAVNASAWHKPHVAPSPRAGLSHCFLLGRGPRQLPNVTYVACVTWQVPNAESDAPDDLAWRRVPRAVDGTCPPGRRPYHTILTAQASVYQEWQTKIFYYHFKKAQAANPCTEMTGFTRLLASAGGNGDSLSAHMPTVTVAQLGHDKTRGFMVINRPWTMQAV